MIGKMIRFHGMRAPAKGPLDRSRRKRNDLPLLRERKRQPASAATSNTLRMSSDAGPILRTAERRYARSPPLFPSNGMQHRHNRMMPLQAPVLPALRQGRGFFHVRDFQKAAAFPPDSLPESGTLLFDSGMHFFHHPWKKDSQAAVPVV